MLGIWTALACLFFLGNLAAIARAQVDLTTHSLVMVRQDGATNGFIEALDPNTGLTVGTTQRELLLLSTSAFCV